MITTIKKIKLVCLIIVSAAMLLNMTGCCKWCNLNINREELTTFGPKPLIDDSFEKIDIALLLNPEGQRINEDDELEMKRDKIEKAFIAFYKNPIDQKRRRNSIQERILSASVQRCGEYKNFLKQFDSGTNFFLGSLTTAIAGAGAIFTSLDTVRALSGTAAIISGVRSEFNEDYFSNQTVHVLTNGFESKRDEFYEKILNRRNQSITQYPVEAAIKDAIEYHAGCSLVAGLEQAALAIERAKNPGLIETQKALVEAKKIQNIMETEPSKISTINLSNPIGLGGDGLINTGLGYDLLYDELPQEVFASVRAYVALIEKDYDSLSKKIKAKEFKGKEEELKKELKEFNEIGTLVKIAKTQTWEVLLQDTGKRADEITAKIQKTKAKIIETIDWDKRKLLEIELAKEMLEGKIVIHEIKKIYLDFQSNYVSAEAALKDKSIPELDTRIKNAKNRIYQFIEVMIHKRLDNGLNVVDKKFKELSSTKQTDLKVNLKKIKDVSDINSQQDIENLLTKSKDDVKEFKSTTNCTDMKKIIKKATSIANTISDSFKD